VKGIFPLFLLLCGFSGAAFAQSAAHPNAASQDDGTQNDAPQNDAPRPILPGSLHWVGVPNAPALQSAWVLGSEQAAGAYVLRVRIAANGHIPPHSHPDTRNSTVLSGTLYVGFGGTFDKSKVIAIPAGAVYVAPADIMHYIWAKDGNVEYQESGVGPTGTVTAQAMAEATASPPQAQESSVAALSWLAGCWRAESADSGSGEQWLPPAGGAMLGVERTIEKGKLVSYGFMRIEANGEGKLVFTASPSGQEQASFTQVSFSGDAITFENLQHDFPQRVMYRLVSSERLAARIEGINDGVEQAIDFPMQRISCDALVRVPP